MWGLWDCFYVDFRVDLFVVLVDFSGFFSNGILPFSVPVFFCILLRRISL
jgi:hypothetical protein